jgi:DNA-binding PadR family transcriptional regulator
MNMTFSLGEFEEIILLIVAVVHDNAYTVSIINEMDERLGRKASISAVQTVLRRLEDKGLLTSAFGEPTSVRGGKRKRYFTLTAAGRRAITESKNQRMELWNAIPNVVMR